MNSDWVSIPNDTYLHERDEDWKIAVNQNFIADCSSFQIHVPTILFFSAILALIHLSTWMKLLFCKDSLFQLMNVDFIPNFIAEWNLDASLHVSESFTFHSGSSVRTVNPLWSQQKRNEFDSDSCKHLPRIMFTWETHLCLNFLNKTILILTVISFEYMSTVYCTNYFVTETYLLNDPGIVILLFVTALISRLITSCIGPFISDDNFELYFSVSSSLW